MWDRVNLGIARGQVKKSLDRQPHAADGKETTPNKTSSEGLVSNVVAYEAMNRQPSIPHGETFGRASVSNFPLHSYLTLSSATVLL